MTGMHTQDSTEIARTLGLSEAPGRAWRRWRWAGLALLALVTASLLLMRGSGTASAPEYQTEIVQRADLTAKVTATGNLQPTNQVDVGIEVSGTIASVEVDFNDQVQIGQVLARLDTSKLDAQLRKSSASLAAAQARVEQMRATLKESGKNLQRLRQMYKISGGKLPSEQELDAAEATYARAQTEVASALAAVTEAEATLKLNQTDIDKAAIRSPINGIVLLRAVEPGQTVAASFQAPVLFTLAEDLTKMELQVDVDEADVGQVQAGQVASFTVDAYPQREFPARVLQVRYGAQVVEGVVTYMAVLNVDNADLALRPGMTATADIIVQKVDAALLVPNVALRFTPPEPAVMDEGGSVLGKLMPRPPRATPKLHSTPSPDKMAQRVWVLRDATPEVIPIQIGTTDGKFTQVLSGDLEAGTAVIVDVESKPSK